MNDNDTDEIQPGEERTLAGRIRKTNPFKSADGRFLPGHRKVGGRTTGTPSYSAHVLGRKDRRESYSARIRDAALGLRHVTGRTT